MNTRLDNQANKVSRTKDTINQISTNEIKSANDTEPKEALYDGGMSEFRNRSVNELKVSQELR